MFCLKLSAIYATGTPYNDFKTSTILVCMILNGKGSAWLWSTSVLSCFCYFLTGHCNMADYIKCELIRGRSPRHLNTFSNFF